jgi:hypothetical protein
LLLLTLSPVSAEGLLRLFTTVQERAALNAERLKPKKPIIKTKPAKTVILSKPAIKIKPAINYPKPPNYITFNGLVLGNNKEAIIWINNSTDLVQQGFRVELDNLTEELSIAIILANSKQRIFLKPGQTLNTLNGTIK